MNKVSLSDKLLAVLLLAIGIMCFARLYFWLSGGGIGALSDILDARISVAVFLAAGVAGLLGAWRLWTGGGVDRSGQETSSRVPLFGRNVAVRPAGKPILRSVFAVFLLVALVALVADRFGAWPLIAEQLANEGSEPGPAPSQPQSSETGLVTSVEPAADAPAPEQVAAPVPPTGQDGVGDTAPTETSNPADETSWPELVLAPELTSPPAITEQPEAAAPPAPPQTTAPMPPPVQLPTQPDGHRDAVVWLSVSPDTRSIMSASTDHTIKLWDIDGKRLIRTLGAHKDMARTALFLPDGASALTAGDDGEVVLRSVADGAVLHVFSAHEHGGANKLALSPDGRRAVSVHQAGTVIVWDIENRTVLHVLTGHDWSISGVAISPDASRTISGSIDGTLKLWDIDKGKLMRSWLGHERGTYGAAFTPDGRQVLTGSGDYTIKLWDVETGREVRRFNGHSGTVYVLDLSKDGKRLLSGSLDGTARLWDVDTGNEIAQFSGHAGPVYAVAFGADGTIITGGRDRTIRFWPAGGGEAIAMFPGAPE